MAYVKHKRFIVFAIMLILLCSLLCACEVEPEDTSIWAQKKLPYDYSLENYVVLGEYIGITDVSISLDYDMSARRDVKIAEKFKDYVTFSKVDSIETGDKLVLECKVLCDKKVCDFLPEGDYEIVAGGQTKLGLLSDAYTESLLVSAMQKAVDGEYAIAVPSYYSDLRYRGKTLTVSVKLKEIYRPDFSALTDDIVALGGDYENLQELYNAVEMEIYAEDAEIKEYAKKRILWDRAVSDATFFTPLPKAEIERCEKEYIDHYTKIAEYNGISYEKYLLAADLTNEQVLENARIYAEQKVKNELFTFALAKKEGLVPSQTQCQMLGHELAYKLGYSGYDELISYNTEESVYIYIIWETAASFIFDNAKPPVANNILR